MGWKGWVGGSSSGFEFKGEIGTHWQTRKTSSRRKLTGGVEISNSMERQRGEMARGEGGREVKRSKALEERF